MGRDYISHGVVALHKHFKQKDRRMMLKCRPVCSIASDMWSSGRNVGTMAIVSTFVDKNMKMHRALLRCAPFGSMQHTADNEAGFIKVELEEGGVTTLFGNVHDHASDAMNCGARLSQHTGCVDFGCMSHAVNLTMSQLMKRCARDKKKSVQRPGLSFFLRAKKVRPLAAAIVHLTFCS